MIDIRRNSYQGQSNSHFICYYQGDKLIVITNETIYVFAKKDIEIFVCG